MPDGNLQRLKSLLEVANNNLSQADFLKAFKQVLTIVNKLGDQLNKKIDARLAKIKDGKDGRPGRDGRDGKPGERGAVGPAGLSVQGEIGLPGRDGSPDTADDIRNKLELLPEGEKLKIDAIENLQKELDDLKKGGGNVGRVIATATSLWHLQDVNVSGLLTGQALQWSGTQWVPFTPSSGGGLTALTATETPNGTLKVFTFSGASAQPSYLVVDNVWLKATTASGTVNWTWNNGTKKATLTVAAADDIWGVV